MSRCWHQAQEGRKFLAGHGGKRAVLRGEHEVSRKAIAQGRPECSSCPVCSCAVLFAQIARETAGAVGSSQASKSSVGPANAGTHCHRPKLFCEVVVTLSFPTRTAAEYGSLLSQGRRWSGCAEDSAYLFRRRFAAARVGAAGEKSQCEPADREDRDQL